MNIQIQICGMHWLDMCPAGDKNSDLEVDNDIEQQHSEQEVNEDHGIDKSDQEADHDNEKDLLPEEDERSRLSGLPYDTCLLPKDLQPNCDAILSIAPGEGKRPQAMEIDIHSEELSFPNLFPSGKYGYSFDRPKKVTMKKYFQSRMLHCDGRFAKNIDYLFYAQYRCEVKEIKDSLSVSMRKAKGEAVTAGEVKGNIANFIRSDLGCHFLQKIRGSPAFYNKLLYDLLGMIRQLGPCTWFITLSAADLKWPDTIRVIAKQQGRFLSDDDIAKMSWEERCHLLRSNPVTAANHFEDRVKQFMKLILLNKNICPLGHILDYKYRVEFQQRGSPHIHMVVWVRDAPTFEINTVEEVAAFVDQHVTCALPTDDDDLKGLLAAVQRHTHSVACKKHGATCRFQFPRPPVRQTTAANPSDPPSKEMEELYLETLAAVQKELNKLEVMEDVSLDILLQHAQVTGSVYMEALKWIKTRNGQPVVLLKRKPKEININNYNTILMNAWQANLDVQFITNVYACVMYVASYISKPEKTLGDVLKGVGASTQHLGAKASMKSIAKKFLTHREVSAQEAVYRLMSLPLSKGSREVVFIATDLPENRTRLMKPIKIIKNLEDDDTDVFQAGYLERYPMRPAIVEDMCLAEFVSKYRYTSRASPKADSDSDTNEDNMLPKTKMRHHPLNWAVVLAIWVGVQILLSYGLISGLCKSRLNSTTMVYWYCMFPGEMSQKISWLGHVENAGKSKLKL